MGASASLGWALSVGGLNPLPPRVMDEPPESLRNRLLKQVLIAIIGFDFTCGGRRGKCQFLGGS